METSTTDTATKVASIMIGGGILSVFGGIAYLAFTGKLKPTSTPTYYAPPPPPPRPGITFNF